MAALGATLARNPNTAGSEPIRPGGLSSGWAAKREKTMLTITFTQDELQALGELLDVAVKATGIAGAKKAVPLFEKLEKAVAEANAPKETE